MNETIKIDGNEYEVLTQSSQEWTHTLTNGKVKDRVGCLAGGG